MPAKQAIRKVIIITTLVIGLTWLGRSWVATPSSRSERIEKEKPMNLALCSLVL